MTQSSWPETAESAESAAPPTWLPRALETPPRFEDLVAPAKGGDIDLGLAAAVLARDVYERLDVYKLLSTFDELAAPLAASGVGHMPAEAQASALGRHLYERHEFAANSKDYYDPRNSLLPDVLHRRLGIPITLALVYCEVAKRAGVPARGVGFPGHFLVRIERPTALRDGAVFIDPFARGRVLDKTGLAALLARTTGKRTSLRPEHLEPASSRTMLVRMLSNLKAVYLARNEGCRALLVADRVLSVVPESGAALRDRGLLAARVGAIELARADLTTFLERNPDGDEALAIRRQLTALERLSWTCS